MHRRSNRRVVTAIVGSVAALAGVVAVSSTAPSAALASAPPRVTAVPFGFADTAVASVPQPTAVHALPDGSVVVLGKAGTLWLVRGGQPLPTPSLTLSVCTSSEQGLLGVAPDPAFDTNGYLYLYSTRRVDGTCVNRVSRVTLVGDVIDPASELILLDGIPSPAGNHNAGDVEVGNDGFLYVTVGDGGRDPRNDSGSAGANDAGADLSLLNGKILRLDRATGAPAPGNPYTGPGTTPCKGLLPLPPTNVVCQEIYASGLRNPYRFAFDPNTTATRFFVNDVGQATREEVNLGVLGADYGWNVREGVCRQGENPPCAPAPAGLTDPITDYSHSYGTFITGGAFVPNGAWPSQFDGGYLFADGGSGRIWLRSADGTVDYDRPFATVEGPADLAFSNDSIGLSLYYVLPGRSVDSVRRITFPRQAVPTASGPLAYTPSAAATRLFDSRLAQDGAAPLAGNTPRVIDTGVDGSVTSAVLVNLTYVQPSVPGFLTAWAAGATRPATSNVNALAGEVVANAAVVPVDAQGRIQVLTNAPAHVVVDLLGRFDPAPGPVRAGRLQPLTPARLADTRDPAGGDNLYTDLGGSPIDVVRVPVAGRFGVPQTGVGSVVLTVTALAGAEDLGGYVTAAPSRTTPPTSNVNTNRAGDIRPNLVVVPLGADGSIDLLLFRTDDVVVDVTGWFTDASVAPGTLGRFHSLAPYREVDTRTPFGFEPFAGPATRVLDPVTVPPGAVAVAQNVTIVDNAAAGFVTAFPAEPRPRASTGNADGPAQLRAASAFTPMGSDGRTRYYAMMPTSLVVDVTGWFEGPPG